MELGNDKNMIWESICGSQVHPLVKLASTQMEHVHSGLSVGPKMLIKTKHFAPRHRQQHVKLCVLIVGTQ